ncbi:MAG: SRPBCC family protein [Chitinophagales bacterium]
MKAVKIIGGIVGVLLVAYIVACAMGPKDFDVTREIDVNAPKNLVYNQVVEFKNWEKWSPWAENDSTLEVTYGEVTRGIGAYYSWVGESRMSGAGSLEIVDAVENESISTHLLFGEQEQPSRGTWTFTENEDGSTHVAWGMDGDPPGFFMRGMILLMGMEQMMIETFDQGLGNIKRISEEEAANMPASTTYDIREVEVAAKTYVGIREVVRMDALSTFFGEKYGAIMGAGVQMEGGAPSALYYSWDEETMTTDIAAVIPVAEAPANVADGMEVFTTEAGKAVQLDYYGDYAAAYDSHVAINEYIIANGLESYLVVEEYTNDPTTVADPSELHTLITYMLK